MPRGVLLQGGHLGFRAFRAFGAFTFGAFAFRASAQALLEQRLERLSSSNGGDRSS